MKHINGFDLDGTISIPNRGVYPGPGDVIITGRSFEEQEVTEKYLEHIGIKDVEIFFNPQEFDKKTTESSALHKCRIIKYLYHSDIIIKNFYEDDFDQASIIKKECPDVNIIMIVHDLVTKGNIRRDEYGNEIK